MFENEKEFIRLARAAQTICESEATWKTKFSLVFSEYLSGELQDLSVDFDWYDPDTTYEEDVLAFCRAINEKADELVKAIGGPNPGLG